MSGIVNQLKFKKPNGFDHNEFAKMLEQAYISTSRDGRGTKKTSFSPSTVGYGHGTCPRYWFIAFNGADFDETKDSSAIANMMNGTFSHDRIQKMMEKTGVIAEIEREIKNDSPPIRGFVDVVVNWDGKEVIGEIKTTKEEVFAIRQTSNKPSGSHLIQVLIYMKINESDEGFVMYENKNTQDICIIPISMNKKNSELIEYTFSWMTEVFENYQSGLLPERSFTKSSYYCKGCPVRKDCWKSLGDGDIHLEKLEVPK